MKKVYLVIQFIERGFASDEKPLKVFKDRNKAEEFVRGFYGFVKEIDYVDD